MADETNSPSRPWSHDLKRADYLHPDSIENKLGLGRVPPEPQEGILWRGMSGGEFKNLLNQGFLKSKGDWNISNTQKGLTIFSSNPRTAEMYAHDFAPRDFKATPGSSAYVVGIKKPSGAIPQTQKNPSEFGIKGRIPIEDIVSVYRGGVFSPKSDRERAVLDWQEIPVSDLLDAASYSGFENLPAVIDAASQLARTQADEPRPKGKGEIFRGIGSLMRRRMFPLIQAAQMGWDALPEDKKKEVQDFLSRPAHELVGMEKPGIEYFKDLLGISEEDLPQSTMRAAGEVNPNPDEPELSIDNPGGAWLQGKLDQAQEDYRTAPVDSARRKVGSSVVTAWFSDPLDLPPDLLKEIPGALGEEAFRESGVKLENLQKSIRERGYEESPILIHVREDGQPFIIEGNHRVVEAVLSKRSTIPVSLRYLRGGETADGLLSPQKIKDFYSKRLGSRMADELARSIARMIGDLE